ncbi:TraR/DksA family transcriptional regulator, partial [Escherichia coli]|nr:TraR/DksA family transcriptional regulator [Escherichia coli]
FSCKLRQMLNQTEIDKELGQDGTRTVTLDQQSVGRLSRMDALQQQAMARAQQSRRDSQANRIRAALARIDHGEYGYCTECGDDIALARLTLDPTVPTCIACARR